MATTLTPDQEALSNKIIDLQNQDSALGTQIFHATASGDTSTAEALTAQRATLNEQINAANIQYSQLPPAGQPTDAVGNSGTTTPADTATVTPGIDEGPTNEGTNPSGKPGANTAVDDGGTTVQTFDDGSTLTTNPDGTTSSTPSPTPPVPLAQANADLKIASDALTEAQNNSNSAKKTLDSAQQALDNANVGLLADQHILQDLQKEQATAIENGEDTTEIDAKIDEQEQYIPLDEQDVTDAEDALSAAQDNFDEANDALATATDAYNTALQTQQASQAAEQAATASGNTESVTNPPAPLGGNGSIDSESQAKDQATQSGAGATRSLVQGANLQRTPLNSVPQSPAAAQAEFSSLDMRVKLRIPDNYLVGPAAGPEGRLKQLGGILFPYTPQVSASTQAAYSQNKVTHSNYQFYNYQSSSVGPITVSGKLTAQNEFEAAYILACQHVLRALTKMKWGNDQNAGSPPPICRFDAYGDYQFKNIPVTVADFKLELPDGVDYIQVGRGTMGYGNTMVPTSCTLSITLNVMYSRTEAMNYGVDAWLNGKLAGKGYL